MPNETINTELNKHGAILKASYLNTPLGKMLAIADETALYCLTFVEYRGSDRERERFQMQTKSAITSGKNDAIASIESELKAYFEGTLQMFKTPCNVLGSAFQKRAWEALMDVPYGQTRSYLQQATSLGKQTAYRAVANANGANQIAIVIPCHRIINNNGDIGGYGGGIKRKQWLLDHEKQHTITGK